MFKAVAAFMAAFLFFGQPAKAEKAEAKGDYVVMLHGIARTSGNMEKMEKAFAKEGYAVLNIDYPSRKATIENLAEELHPKITAFATDETRKIHFVGHSMGCILARAYIFKHRPKNLGRVVMLGPPNKGSEAADFLKDNFIFQGYYGPAGQELATDNAFDREFGKIDYETGIIAGDRTIDPVSSYLILKGPNDGKVTVENTKAEGMTDHIVIHATHTFIMKNKQAIAQALHFVKNGKFAREEKK